VAGFFHYVRVGPQRVEEDEHPEPVDNSVHQVDPTVHVYDPGKPGGQGEQRP
jgi:formate dehydrogenase iron-sulfur subunit